MSMLLTRQEMLHQGLVEIDHHTRCVMDGLPVGRTLASGCGKTFRCQALARQQLGIVGKDDAHPFIGQLVRALLSFVISRFFSPFGSRLWSFDANRKGEFFSEKQEQQHEGQQHQIAPAKNGSGQNKAFAPRLGRCRFANPCAHARRCAFAVWRGFAGVGGGGSVNPVRCRAVFAAAPHERLIVMFTSTPNGCVGTSIMPLCPQGAGTLKRHRRKA